MSGGELPVVSPQSIIALLISVIAILWNVISSLGKHTYKLQLEKLTSEIEDLTKALEEEKRARNESAVAQGTRIGRTESEIHSLHIHASGVHERLGALDALPGKVDALTISIARQSSKIDMLMGATSRSDQIAAVAVPRPRAPYPSKPDK